MRRKILWIGVLISACLPVSFLLMDTVREVINVPYQQIMKFFYRADQGLLWFFVMGMVVFIAYRALVRVPSLPEFRKKQPQQRGPVAEMIYLLEMSQTGSYSRGKLLRHLKELAIQVMALQRRSSPALIEQGIKSGALTIPLELRSFFEFDEKKGFAMETGNGKKAFSKREKLTNLDIEPLLRYLENEMDIRTLHEDQ